MIPTRRAAVGAKWIPVFGQDHAQLDAYQLSRRPNEPRQVTLPAAAAATIRDVMTLIDLANPTRFLTLTTRLLPWLAATTAVLLLIGLYQSAMAPDDYQQGATVKIMFIHVPNAWLSMFVWGLMSLAALGTLVWRHPLADVAAKAAAPIGAAFTFLALVTGSLWGRPMWGTYWEWDAQRDPAPPGAQLADDASQPAFGVKRCRWVPTRLSS
jgi:ABC-type transport system involved in cytochrome c biogenesis permease subunit